MIYSFLFFLIFVLALVSHQHLDYIITFSGLAAPLAESLHFLLMNDYELLYLAFRSFSLDVIAAILMYINKRFLIRFFSFVHQHMTFDI